jgi:hypothetical protein
MFEKVKSNKSEENSLSIESCPASEELLSGSEGELAKIKDGLWSQEEILKFISYLIYNREGLKLKLQRR